MGRAGGRARLVARPSRANPSSLHPPAASISEPDAAAALASLPPARALAADLPGAASAAALLRRDAAATRIITFCADLDRMLGGGVAPGQLTEFCESAVVGARGGRNAGRARRPTPSSLRPPLPGGAPAAGKTQLILQLAVDAAIPAAFGGADGDALIIDTEGSILPERGAALAAALTAHLTRLAARDPGNEAKRAAAPALGDVLARVRVLRARDAAALDAALASLPALCDRYPTTKLVAIDSIAFHARAAGRGGAPARARALAAAAARLASLARERDIAVVVTNQVTTRVGGGGGGGGAATDAAARLVPALGPAWAHAPTTRVLLHWRAGARVASLVKSPSLPASRAEFTVTADGVRGAPRKRNREDGDGEGRNFAPAGGGGGP